MSRYGWGGDVWLNNNGVPLSGGALYFYETGTTTPKNTYSDADETIANTNPVILDAAGRQGDIFFNGLAKIVIQNADGAQIDVVDPIGSSDAAGDFDDWVITREYYVGDTVTGPDGNYYKSITLGNLGNSPSISPAAWQRVQFLFAYNEYYSYSVGDIATVASKVYVSLAGTNLGNTPATSPASWQPLADDLWLDSVVKTANFTAVTGRRYLINTGGGAFTMTLPLAPTNGDQVAFADYGGTFGTNNLTIGRNASNIVGDTSDLVCDLSYFNSVLTFTTGRGWTFT